jgi:hypothetical protein
MRYIHLAKKLFWALCLTTSVISPGIALLGSAVFASGVLVGIVPGCFGKMFGTGCGLGITSGVLLLLSAGSGLGFGTTAGTTGWGSGFVGDGTTGGLTI